MGAVQVIHTGSLATFSTTWTALDSGGAIDLVIAASAGDVIEVGTSVLSPTTAGYSWLDAATMVSGSPVNWVSTGGSTHSGGPMGWFTSIAASIVNHATGGSVLYTVQAGDLSGGNIRFRFYAKNAGGTQTPTVSADRPAHFYAVTRYTAVTTTTGSGTATAPAPTATGTGTAETAGTGTATAPVATGTGTGTTTATGEGTATAPAPGATGTGTADDTTSGAGTATGPTPTGAGTGETIIPGEGTGTAPTPTGSGTGTTTVTGEGTATAPVPTGSGTGTFTPGATLGTGTATAPLPTAQGAGTTTEPTATANTDVIVETLAWVELTSVPDLDEVTPILRESYVMPPLDADHPSYQHVRDYPVVHDYVATVQIWVGNENVTYFRGHPTLVRRWDSEKPFGDKLATFELPQLDPWDKPGEGDLAWLYPDAPVYIGFVDEEGGVRRAWGPGFLDRKSNSFARTVDHVYTAKGDMWVALHQNHEPPPYMAPVDIGTIIPRLYNNLRGRRGPAMAEVATGLMTRNKGARDQYVWQVMQDILSKDGWTDDLRQWTITQDEAGAPHFTLSPPMSVVAGTAAYGTPLVEMELETDQSSRCDILWSRGVAQGGAGWANVFYPGLELINPPPYFNADAGVFLGLGDTDAGTTSGTGVTDFQRQARQLKFTSLPITGVLTSAWVPVVRAIQAATDITVDGSIGPQTWNALWDRGDEDIDLTPLRLPMWMKPTAWKTKHSATGRVIGENPLWDETMVPREIPVDWGAPISRAEGRELSAKYGALFGDPITTGQLTFIGCPNDIDRTRLTHGDNFLVTGYEGEDITVQLSRKTVEMDGDADGRQYVVSFDASTRALDALTVDQLIERNRAALPDPSRRPGNPNRSTRNVRDEGFSWDDDSPCGVVPRTAVNGATGLWSVITVPLAEIGQLAAIVLNSTQPFAFAIFASLRITENKLAALVGNPFASTDPWRPHMRTLEDEYGLIGCWGAQDEACGFSPLQEGDEGAEFTGLFEHYTTLEYVTETPPYASFAFYFRGDAGFVDGEARPARQIG